ncbi:MAG TPA: RDD family protein [Archangium sp.]|nr:RDD family protein [Archangium sp.]
MAAPAPAPVQAAAPRPPAAPPPAPSFNLPGVAAPTPAPRSSTPAFGVPQAGLPNMPVANAPAALDLAIEEESFSVDLEESEPAASPPVAAAPARSPAPAAPKLGGTVSKETEIHARPASLWRRLLALAIDAGAIAGVAALYLMLASSVAGVQAPQTSLSGLDAIIVQIRALQSVLLPGTALLLVLSLVYCAVSAFLWNGRTLGRRLLGLRLVDTHGLAPAPGRAIVRAMLASLSFGLFLAGFWMALFDRRGQTLHDKLTSTYVVQPS